MHRPLCIVILCLKLSTPNWLKKTGPSGEAKQEAKQDVFYRLTQAYLLGPVNDVLDIVVQHKHKSQTRKTGSLSILTNN